MDAEQRILEHLGFGARLSEPRASATPANDQYATPALGFGGNAALIGAVGKFPLGSGRRSARRFRRVARNVPLLSARFHDEPPLRRQGNHRGALWRRRIRHRRLAAHRRHRAPIIGRPRRAISSKACASTGAITNDQDYPGRDGIVPTARAVLRRNFADQYLRAAAYAGFRVPTLNELYRPFRVGNNTTNANAALKPEKLYGAEIGWGGNARRASCGNHRLLEPTARRHRQSHARFVAIGHRPPSARTSAISTRWARKAMRPTRLER